MASDAPEVDKERRLRGTISIINWIYNWDSILSDPSRKHRRLFVMVVVVVAVAVVVVVEDHRSVFQNKMPADCSVQVATTNRKKISNATQRSAA